MTIFLSYVSQIIRERESSTLERIKHFIVALTYLRTCSKCGYNALAATVARILCQYKNITGAGQYFSDSIRIISREFCGISLVVSQIFVIDDSHRSQKSTYLYTGVSSIPKGAISRLLLLVNTWVITTKSY